MRTQLFTAASLGLTGAAWLAASPAFAYQISHSYPAAQNATEFHGTCNNGARIVIVQEATGGYSYRGPGGDGRLGARADLDEAARKACGE